MTMKDVAEKAGVSLSTVSYVVNGNRPISEEKKQRVRQAMEELHYRPHAIARSLASKHSRILAMLFPPVERGMGASEFSLLSSAAQLATAKGYHLVFWSLKTKTAKELEGLLSQELVDGVILMEVHAYDFRIPILKQANIPFVLVGRDPAATGAVYVDTDFDRTMLDALAYLIGKGHSKIGFINQSKEAYDAGYGPVVRTSDAFQNFGRTLRFEGHALFCSPNPHAGYDLVVRDLEEHPDCTAFIVMNDRSLAGVIKGIESTGRRIPDDCSLVSIVSSAGAACLYLPQLTTFELQGERQMEAAITNLICLLENTYCAVKESLVPCLLAERESSASAPIR
ncbi:MAG: LacI family transcriptional regulator [Sphaerochaeta sp.]|jgi:DNA-binding LacI/PurR family transcriptional regulator|nr:LacI family transcriptional regulator [Sphaerochaeta sp.]